MVVAVPSQPGTQVGAVVVLIDIVGAFGAVNCMVVVPVQPLASVTVMAVSYTHLDVYKRQVQPFASVTVIV